MQQRQQFNEGLEMGDLKYLVDNTLHFDEYNSKMGQPSDVVTMSFKVRDIMPANDLVSYMENGYDWVLDADVSSGEIQDGHRLVFVEFERNKHMFTQIDEMLTDLDHLTGVKPDTWKFRWYNQRGYEPMNEDNFKKFIPQTPRSYTESMESMNTVMTEAEKIKEDLEVIKKLSGIK